MLKTLDKSSYGHQIKKGNTNMIMYFGNLRIGDRFIYDLPNVIYIKVNYQEYDYNAVIENTNYKHLFYNNSIVRKIQ